MRGLKTSRDDQMLAYRIGKITGLSSWRKAKDCRVVFLMIGLSQDKEASQDM